MGWEYYESEKGENGNLDEITWSYNRNYKGEATAWLTLYTVDKIPQMLQYEVFNQSAYKSVSGGISAQGFSFSDSEIEDDMISSYYSSSAYDLKVITRQIDDNLFNQGSTTGYTFVLRKKGGYYDSNNGFKTFYWANSDKLMRTYTLKDGNFHGIYKEYNIYGDPVEEINYVNGIRNGKFKLYHDNGMIKMEGSNSNGEINGTVKMYDEYGQLIRIAITKNGELQGVAKDYNGDGLITAISNYHQGELDGNSTHYYYTDEGEKQFVVEMEYEGGLKHGRFQNWFYVDGEKINYGYKTFKNGECTGPFVYVTRDSIIYGNYIDSSLNGEYIVYEDYLSQVGITFPSADTSGKMILRKGRYLFGEKNGYWINYFIGEKSSEGRFESNKKEGTWKYYNKNFVNEEGNLLKYAGELALTQEFKNGERHGRAELFFYKQENQYQCVFDSILNRFTDTCYSIKFIKTSIVSFHKYDKLNGEYVAIDSLGNLRAKGFFLDGKEDGKWEYRTFNGEEFYFSEGEMKNGEKVGEWRITFEGNSTPHASYSYKNGQLHGTSTFYYENGNIKNQRVFENGIFIGYKSYNLFNTLQSEYNLSEIKSYSYKCEVINYYEEGVTHTNYLVNQSLPEDDYYFAEVFLLLLFYEDTAKIKKDGEYLDYDSNNNLLTFGKYINDLREGDWKYYSHDQRIARIVPYKKGQNGIESYATFDGESYSGEFRYNNLSNSTYEIRQIKNGLRHGKTIIYDQETNEKIEVVIHKNGIPK